MGKNEANDNGNVNIVLTYDGTVHWTLPVQYASSCIVDMTAFPYDEQTCSFSFAPWAYHSKQVDIVSIDFSFCIGAVRLNRSNTSLTGKNCSN